MVVQTNGREYVVTELTHEWKARRTVGGVSVNIHIPKEAAPDEAAVKQYITEHDDIF